MNQQAGRPSVTSKPEHPLVDSKTDNQTNKVAMNPASSVKVQVWNELDTQINNLTADTITKPTWNSEFKEKIKPQSNFKDMEPMEYMQAEQKNSKTVLNEFISTLKRNLNENRKMDWTSIYKFYQAPDKQTDLNILAELVDNLKTNAKLHFYKNRLESNAGAVEFFNENWSNLQIQIDSDTKYSAGFHSLKNTSSDSTEVLCKHFESLKNFNEDWSIVNIELVNKLFMTNTKNTNYEFDSNNSYEQQAMVLKFTENFKANLGSWSKILVDIIYKPDQVRNEIVKYDIKINDAHKISNLLYDVKSSNNWTKVSLKIFVGFSWDRKKVFFIRKVNIETKDEYNCVKKYQIVNDYYGAIGVFENLIEKFKNGKDQWQVLKGDILFQIPVGPNKMQRFEIANDDQQPDKSFALIDDLIETLEKKEKKWSKLKFGIQSCTTDIVANEETVTYEIKKTDEQKLKILDTIIRNLKADDGKWDECNIKILSEINEKLQLEFNDNMNMVENLRMLENRLKTKWKQVNVVFGKKEGHVHSDTTKHQLQNIELNLFYGDNDDLKRLEKIVSALRSNYSNQNSASAVEPAWLNYTTRIVESIKNQEIKWSIESLETLAKKLQNDGINYSDDKTMMSIHMLGLFLFKLKNIDKIVTKVNEKSKKEAKLVQINRPPKPPLSGSTTTMHRVSTTTRYDFAKPTTRVYELHVNDQEPNQTDSQPWNFGDANSPERRSFVKTAYDHPFLRQASENEIVLNTGLQNTDYVQIHPLLNDKTVIQKSESNTTSRFTCEFNFRLSFFFL